MDKTEFYIPLAENPLSYQQFTRVKKGRVVKLNKLKGYQTLIAWHAKKAWNRDPVKKEFKIDIVLHFKSKVHADPDNCLKAIMDALGPERRMVRGKMVQGPGILFENDKFAKDTRVRYEYRDRPGIEIGFEVI